MCAHTLISAEESSRHVQFGRPLNGVARVGRAILLTECRKVTATAKASGSSLCPERLPVGKIIIIPVQMHHIPE